MSEALKPGCNPTLKVVVPLGFAMGPHIHPPYLLLVLT